MLKSVSVISLLKISVCIITLVSLFFGTPFSHVDASEAFVINDYEVNIVSFPDKSFEIQEVISLHFSEERRGIFRAIPRISGKDRYIISDIHVDGDPFVIEQDPLNTVIRIGNPDVYIRGPKQYRISYRLRFEPGSDPDEETVNLNVIGHSWDTTINRAVINFYYPEGADAPHDFAVYAGEYGSQNQDMVSAQAYDDRITIKTQRALNNYQGITLSAAFAPDTFSLADKITDPYSITDYNANIDIRKDRSVKFKESFNVDFKSGTESFYHFIPFYTSEGEKVRIRNIRLNGRRIPFEYYWGVMPLHITSPGKNLIEYTVYYPVSTQKPEKLEISLLSDLNFVSLDSLSVEINSHAEFESFIHSGEVTNFDTNINLDENTVYLTSVSSFGHGAGFNMSFIFPENSFGSVLRLHTVFIIFAGLLLSAISYFLYLKYGKDKFVSPVIEFYPPDKLSSASLGYVINHAVNPIDISSILLYWASHNHISFTATSKKDFDISLDKPIDDNHAFWEKNAFEELSRLIANNGGTLSKSSLQKDFYKVSEKMKDAIPMDFRDKKSLKDSFSLKISSLISFLGAVFLAFIAAFSVFSATEQPALSLIAGAVFFIITFMFYTLFTFLRNGWHIRKPLSNMIFSAFAVGAFLVFISACLLLLFLSGATVQPVGVAIGLFIVFFIIIVSVFSVKRSDYGHNILERIIGFKEFLETAEKERLEALLEDDPEYYYNILPYALVLGVSDIWEKKFKGLELSQPSWYHGNYTGYMFSYAALTTFAKSTTASVSAYTSPPASGKAGGFTGGGGFSGGGGGGGGGGSW